MPHALTLFTDPDIIPARDPKIPVPKKAVAIEVDLSFDSTTKIISLEIVKVYKSSGSFSKHSDFLDWAKGQVTAPKWGKKSGFNAKPGKRKPTKMSLRNKEKIYLLVKLSENPSWRFTADGAPLSADKYLQGAGVFSDSFAFDPSGNVITTPSSGVTCKHAYTIIDCDKAKETMGSDDFEARYNLHVDLVENPTDLANSPYIPVILDPDVRWPGGDGP